LRSIVPRQPRSVLRWRGTGNAIDLSFPSRSLAFYLQGGEYDDVDLYVMINAYTEPLTFTICDGFYKPWVRVIDTSRPSPFDILEPGHEEQVIGSQRLVPAHSVTVLAQ
jgi:isoamylase